MPDHLTDHTAVSYTHLDVYKRQQYIKGNLRLVLSVIKRFQNSNENADDLFQIGCIGLMTVSYTHLDVYKRQPIYRSLTVYPLAESI